MQYFISVVQEIGSRYFFLAAAVCPDIDFFYAARPAGMFWTYVQNQAAVHGI